MTGSPPLCLTLFLGLPPSRGNSRLHWAAQKRAEDAWAKKALVVLQNTRKCPPKPLEHYTLHCIVYSKRMMDRDGATSRLKRAIDLLCGSPKNVKGLGTLYRTPRWVAGDSPDHLTELTVVPAVDAKHPRLEVHLDGA